MYIYIWLFIDSLILKNRIGTAPHPTFLFLVFGFYFWSFGPFESTIGTGTPPRASGTTNSIRFRSSFIQVRSIFAISDQFSTNKSIKNNVGCSTVVMVNNKRKCCVCIYIYYTPNRKNRNRSFQIFHACQVWYVYYTVNI